VRENSSIDGKKYIFFAVLNSFHRIQLLRISHTLLRQRFTLHFTQLVSKVISEIWRMSDFKFLLWYLGIRHPSIPYITWFTMRNRYLAQPFTTLTCKRKRLQTSLA